MPPIEIYSTIAELGAIAVLTWWVYTLRQDVKALTVSNEKKTDQHNQDLKTHSSEIQSIYENLVNENLSLNKLIKSTIDELTKKNRNA